MSAVENKMQCLSQSGLESSHRDTVKQNTKSKD